MLTSMPFDGTSSGRKCYGAGRRRLSFGSFQKGLEIGKGLRSNGTSNIAGFFSKKPIHELGLGKTERIALMRAFLCR